MSTNFTFLYKRLLIFLILLNSGLNAQTAVSGRLDLNGSTEGIQRVYLYKLNVNGLKNPLMAEEVGWSALQSDGSFTFNSKHLSDQDAIYRLHLNLFRSNLNDTIVVSKPFILSKKDRINFESGEQLFQNYSTTNKADQEWTYLRNFEKNLQKSKLEAKEDDGRRKGFIKDSLHILLVKLIGIQQLEEKRLLDQDIAKNGSYYLSLLEELQKSELPTSEYEFLERKLAFLTQGKVEQKYASSKVIIVFLALVVVILIGYNVYHRKQSIVLVDLSKQEQTIKRLILEGKSNKEIANELFISLSTVKTHITNLYSKLRVSSRQELLQKTHN